MVHLVVVVLAAFVAAALLTAAGVAAFCVWAQRTSLLDVPNARSSHSVPVPRAAGVVFVIVVPLVFAAAELLVTGALPSGIAAWWATSWLLAAVSLYDDWRGLPAVLRLAVQLAAAVAFLAATGTLLPLWQALLLVLWLAGVSNVYNFMDGVDGLAAGQAVLVMAVLAWLGLLRGYAWLPVLAAAVSGGAAGFLAYNFPVARVFMGTECELRALGTSSKLVRCAHTQKAATPAAVISAAATNAASTTTTKCTTSDFQADTHTTAVARQTT